jgi:pheromone shutdown protein TraB
MITIVGVGHVFRLSENIKNIIRSRRPEIVCLELDQGRYRALMDRSSRGKVPLQYRILSFVQKRMADKFGSEVGDEMLAAVSAANEVGAKVAFIDMDAARMFASMWGGMSFKERARLITGALAGLFLSKERVEIEVERYEEHGDKYIETLGAGFPTVKKVLIDDRNMYMARNIQSIAAQHASVLAVVGDGHIPGLVEALKPLEVETVRLKDLRNVPEVMTEGAEVTTSFWYHS